MLCKELDKWSSVESGPFFSVLDSDDWLCSALPQGYLEIAKAYGGREGFLGQQYLRLYRPEELRALNEAYEINLYHPGLVMFASDGYGEGFAFLRQKQTVFKIPLIPIPIDAEEMDVAATSFDAFVRRHSDIPATLRPNPSCVGKELHLKKPLCFGGDWKDAENQIMVTPIEHVEIVRYWNKLYRDLLAQQNKEE